MAPRGRRRSTFIAGSRLAALVALGLLAPTASLAQPPPLLDAWTGDFATLSTTAEWASRPTSDEIKAAYPKGATGNGYLNLTCRALADGRLTDCEVREEAPKDKGFGAAALSLMPKFRLATNLIAETHGKGGHVHFLLGFRGEGPDLAPCPTPFCTHTPLPPPPPAPKP